MISGAGLHLGPLFAGMTTAAAAAAGGGGAMGGVGHPGGGLPPYHMGHMQRTMSGGEPLAAAGRGTPSPAAALPGLAGLFLSRPGEGSRAPTPTSPRESNQPLALAAVSPAPGALGGVAGVGSVLGNGRSSSIGMIPSGAGVGGQGLHGVDFSAPVLQSQAGTYSASWLASGNGGAGQAAATAAPAVGAVAVGASPVGQPARGGTGPGAAAVAVKKKRSSAQKSDCVVCMDARPCVVLFPCKHSVLCQDCWQLLQRRPAAECPMCRSTVERFELL
jgi:hypothetical protein